MVNRKKNYINIFNKKTIIFLQILIIIAISIPLVKNLSKRYLINNEITELNNEISELEGKNLKLKELISYLESDQYIEEQSRLNLGLKKEGEEVMVVENQKKLALSAQSDKIKQSLDNDSNSRQSSYLSNLNKWWEYFF